MADSWPIGLEIGGYTIKAVLGEGGMATVYRANSPDGTESAIKIISTKLTAHREFVIRFERESRLMAALNHPHILPIYTYGNDEEVGVYLVMRLLSGGSLSQRAREKPLPQNNAAQIITQIASALDYAHSKGVIHRDLKPSNVLLDLDGTPYLSDFGIAKWKEESVGLTAAGAMIGTPGYMSPEQWRSEEVSPQTDVYALGVMAFQLLSGQMPFRAETPFSLMYYHLDKEPPAISDVVVLPHTVDQVIRRAMAKLPERRYPSAGLMATALSDALSGHLTILPARPPRSTKSQPVMPLRLDKPTSTPTDNIVPATENESTLTPSSEPGYVFDSDATGVSEEETLGEIGDYDAIDSGARVLLTRSNEASRLFTGSVATLARAVTAYVGDLRAQAKRRPDPKQGPYKSLDSYDIADNRLFFGRETAIDALLARSPYHKLTLLHAESGAGKTSLIRAGVMPRLLAGGFLPLYVTVRRRPPHEAIKHILLPDPSVVPDLADAPLRTYFKALAESCGHNREFFVFVDQFETFFTDVFTDEQRATFITELAECLDDPLLPVRVTLAMRTEYFGLVASFQPGIDQPFAHEFLLRALTRDEAKRAMTLPAERQGYQYDEDVAEVILNDLAGKGTEVAPPQLQLVGAALIESLPEGRKTITQQAYQQAGGTAGVLRGYLERLLLRLPAAHRSTARLIVEGLVRADQTRDVRTEASLRGELELLSIPTEGLNETLTELRENRVLRVVEGAQGELAYELVHDYLALQVQIDPETVSRKAAQELIERRLGDYERYGSLLTREELNIVTAQQDRLRLNDSARALIARTQAVQRRQRRTLIGLIVAAVLGLLGAMGLGLLATVRETQNQQDRLIAAQTAQAQIRSQRDVALTTESRRLADLAIQQLTTDPMTSLNLALEAFTPPDRPYVPEAEFALTRALQLNRELAYMPSQKRVNKAIWNAGETRVLTYSDDGTVRIFDSSKRMEQFRLDHPQSVTAAAWSPDNTLIAAAQQDGAAQLYEAASGKLRAALTGHSKRINGLTWSADSARLLTWSEDGTARIWDAKTGQTLFTLKGHTGSVTLALWNPQYTQVLTIGADQTLRLWNAASGQSSFVLSGHVNRIGGAVWNAAGTRLLSYGDDRKAIVWDVGAGKPILTLSGHQKEISAASWSPDEKQIVTAGLDGVAILWDAETGKELHRFLASGVIDGVAWNKAGSRIASYGDALALAIWDTNTGKQIAALKGPAESVLGVVWSHNQTRLLAYSRDAIARIWDAETGEQIALLSGHTDAITSAVWSSDDSQIVTASADGSARMWTLRNSEMQRLAAQGGQVLTAIWTANASRMVTGHQDGKIRVWDASTGKLLSTLSGHTASVRQVVASPDDKRFLSRSEDNTVRVWDLSDGRTIATLTGHQALIVTAIWNADGSRILTSSEDGTARVWDSQTGKELLRVGNTPGGIWSAVWDRKEARLLAAGADGKLQVWDSQTGKLLQQLSASDQPLLGAVWNRDETLILVWGYDNFAHVFDAKSGVEKLRLRGHGDWVTSAMWNGTETMLLTTSSDGTARLWDATTGAESRRFAGHTDSVIEALWNADYTRFLTRSADSTVRLWDVASGVEVLRIDGHTARVRSIAWGFGEQLILTASEDGTARVWRSYPTLAELIEHGHIMQTRLLTADQRKKFFLAEAAVTPTPTARSSP